MKKVVTLSGKNCSFEQIIAIANGAKVSIDTAVLPHCDKAWAVVQHMVKHNIPAYGITTPLGHESGTQVSADQMKYYLASITAQHATRQYAVGQGPALETNVVRTAMAGFIQAFLSGKAPVRKELIQELTNRVNAPESLPSIELDGSIGAADLVQQAQMADDIARQFPLQAGEQLALMSGSHITLARAATLLERTDHLLSDATLTVALSFHGFLANPESISELALEQQSPSEKRIGQELRALIPNSPLWQKDQRHSLQPALSLRSASKPLASARDALEKAKNIVTNMFSSYQGNPMVDVENNHIITTSNFDATELSNAVKTLQVALGRVIQDSALRGQNFFNTEQTGLTSGLASSEAGLDGLYTRNIPYHLVAFARQAAGYAQPPHPFASTSVFGDSTEDSSSTAPQSVDRLEQLLVAGEKTIALEAFIAAAAIDLRMRLHIDQPDKHKTLAADALPTPLKNAFDAFAAQHPRHLDAGEIQILASILATFQKAESSQTINPLRDADFQRKNGLAVTNESHRTR